MPLKVENFDDQTRFRQILEIRYSDLVPFILDYLRRKSAITIFFWSVCLLFLGIAVSIRINIAGYFLFSNVFLHTMLGLVIFPLL